MSSLTKNKTFHSVAVAILKNLSSKHLAVSLGVKLVLLPKTATSVRIVFAFLKFFLALILKKCENYHQKQSRRKMELKKTYFEIKNNIKTGISPG